MTPIDQLNKLTIIRLEPQNKKGLLRILDRKIDALLAEILSDGA